MGKPVLTEADLRAVLRLVNEARDLPRSSRDQLEFFMRGLAKLVGAQVGIYGDVDYQGNISPVLDFGWSTDAERNVFVKFAEGQTGLPDDPVLDPFLRSEPDPVIALTRQDVIEDRVWYRNAHVQELRRAARVDSCIYAGWEQANGMRGFGLHRAWGDLPFGERERALVSAVCAECTFLREPDRLTSLPPRLREVLSLLAIGRSEKQIAAELDLSAHTVHDYVKALHRRLGVQSRGELLAVALRA
jgi:DNA-binding CsgD family transcriptional regulator